MTTWTRFYDFIPTKEEEEKRPKSGVFPLTPIRWNRIEIRNNPYPPLLLNLYHPWESKKILTANDVSHQKAYLELGREHVQRHWSLDWDAINGGEQVSVVIRDVDTRSEFNLLLSKYPTYDTFVVHTDWPRDFIIRRDLKEGDVIGMYWNRISPSICFSVLKRAGIK